MLNATANSTQRDTIFSNVPIEHKNKLVVWIPLKRCEVGFDCPIETCCR